jgi:hypothetical protein
MYGPLVGQVLFVLGETLVVSHKTELSCCCKEPAYNLRLQQLRREGHHFIDDGGVG